MKFGVRCSRGAIDVINRAYGAWRHMASASAAVLAFFGANLSLPVSAVVLAIAGAAAIGAFDSPSAARETAEATSEPRIALSYPPDPTIGPLVVTYYFVDSETAAEA